MLKIPIPHQYCNSPPGIFISLSDFDFWLARCGSWTCESCARRKSRELASRLSRVRYNWLLTFTARAAVDVSRETIREFNRSWRRISQFLKRQHPAATHIRKDGQVWSHASWKAVLGAYVWSNERGEEHGHLHKHVAASISHNFCYVCLRARLPALGLGIVCDFKRISWQAKHAIGYVVKYVTKGGDRWAFPRYSRRVQTNHLPAKPRSSGSAKAVYIKRISRDEESIYVLAPSGVRDSTFDPSGTSVSRVSGNDFWGGAGLDGS